MTRKKILRSLHYFDCKCVACKNNFFTNTIPISKTVPDIARSIDKIRIGKKFDYEYTLSIFEMLIEFMMKYDDPEMPCMQVISARRLWQLCYCVLLKIAPFFLKFIENH